MAKAICPGQDLRFWRPGDIFDVGCGRCGQVLEFFKDEARRRCPRCGNRVVNPKMHLGCAQWCEHAKKCLGFDPKESGGDEHEEALVDRLIDGMRKAFGEDPERVSRSLALLDEAQALLREGEGQPAVVLAAAILYEVGTGKGARGLSITESILEEAGLEKTAAAHVIELITSEGADTPESGLLMDACRLVEMKDNDSGAEIASFRTEAGRGRARQILGISQDLHKRVKF